MVRAWSPKLSLPVRLRPLLPGRINKLRFIKKILSVERKKSAVMKDYYVTTILDSEGDESQGFGKDFEVGARVEVFFDEKWNKAKFQLYEP